jgi:FdrA protein
MTAQIQLLEVAGAIVMTSNDVAARYVGRVLRSLEAKTSSGAERPPSSLDPAEFRQPLVAINVGVESFAESLVAQGAEVVHVDWRPAAGGNERLAGILERMKTR